VVQKIVCVRDGHDDLTKRKIVIILRPSKGGGLTKPTVIYIYILYIAFGDQTNPRSGGLLEQYISIVTLVYHPNTGI